ncbi:hypothetical protein [Xanthobacter agilis]|uniref:hypothetical protein n=1 Tax=Xanthobacter agilis TaxID=47492 RepID=UPI003729A80E
MREIEPSPVFSGAVLSDPRGAASLVYRCPWCEELHIHGLAGATPAQAVGTTETRMAHCHDRLSPLPGQSVDIAIEKVVKDAARLARPAAYLAIQGDPAKTAAKLASILGNGALAAALARVVFRLRSGVAPFDVKLVGGVVHASALAGWWSISGAGGREVAGGVGLGRLLAAVFGVPVGVVADRVLGDALGLDLPAEYRLLLAAVIDRAERGEPAPRLVEGGP